MTVIAEMHRVH